MSYICRNHFLQTETWHNSFDKLKYTHGTISIFEIRPEPQNWSSLAAISLQRIRSHIGTHLCDSLCTLCVHRADTHQKRAKIQRKKNHPNVHQQWNQQRSCATYIQWSTKQQRQGMDYYHPCNMDECQNHNVGQKKSDMWKTWCIASFLSIFKRNKINLWCWNSG